jgi:periplasmic divalent cation tolerance protein
MEETGKIVVLITTSSGEEARKIAMLLLEQRKAACVNIIPKVDSLFWWQGKIDSAHEGLLVVKTRVSLLSEVVEIVKTAHSYKVPEIIALPVIGGNEDYLNWIDKEVQEKQKLSSLKLSTYKEKK